VNYRKLDQETRDINLKVELSTDKVNLIDKLCLQSTPDLYWVSRKENAHKHIIFKHNYLKNNDILHVLFRVNRLCFAKVNYFCQNAEKYEPQIYDYKKGFTKTEWWNTEFLRHKASGYQIDLRYLQTITDIEKFKELCAYFESIEIEHKERAGRVMRYDQPL
jgi:hypothetical protein